MFRSFFWSSTPSPLVSVPSVRASSPSPSAAESAAEGTPSQAHAQDDEFVLVDRAQASDTPLDTLQTEKVDVKEDNKEDSQKTVDTASREEDSMTEKGDRNIPSEAEAQPSVPIYNSVPFYSSVRTCTEYIPDSQSRACRPYGAAHSPPALLPQRITVHRGMAATISSSLSSPHHVKPSSFSSSSSSSPALKRSFASVAASSSSSSSSTAKSPMFAYAQPASAYATESAMLKQIEKMSAEILLNGNECGVSSDAPVPTPVRLPRESARLYVNEDVLDIEEPSSKRTKRAAVGYAQIIMRQQESQAKRAKLKSKPAKVARVDQKEMNRARGEKAQMGV